MNILGEKTAFQRVISRHLMTMGESQLEVKLIFWKARQKNQKEIDSSLKLISLCIVQVRNNKYFVVKANSDSYFF